MLREFGDPGRESQNRCNGLVHYMSWYAMCQTDTVSILIILKPTPAGGVPSPVRPAPVQPRLQKQNRPNISQAVTPRLLSSLHPFGTPRLAQQISPFHQSVLLHSAQQIPSYYHGVPTHFTHGRTWESSLPQASARQWMQSCAQSTVELVRP